MLDEELARLPARLKEAVILRDLESHSRSEAAKRMGVSLSTVDNRLSRGRKLLRERLVRRGVSFGSASRAAALSRCAEASLALGIELVGQTVRNAQLFLAGKSAEGMSAATRITSLAQGVLNTMLLNKLSTTVCILALAVALVLGASPLAGLLGGSSEARAQLADFLDDFNDRNLIDGEPVTWQPLPGFANGEFDASGGDLVIRPRATGESLITFVEGYDQLTTTSIRAEVRLNGQIDGLLLGARGTIGGGAYWGGISLGQFEIAKSRLDGSYQVLQRAPSPLNPNAEDVLLQFEVVGDQLSLYAWRPGEPKPSLPQASTADNQYPNGTVGILVDLAQPGSAATIRYVEVQSVPEPAAVALGSLGFVALAAFGVRSRLTRLRPPQ